MAECTHKRQYIASGDRLSPVGYVGISLRGKDTVYANLQGSYCTFIAHYKIANPDYHNVHYVATFTALLAIYDNRRFVSICLNTHNITRYIAVDMSAFRDNCDMNGQSASRIADDLPHTLHGACQVVARDFLISLSAKGLLAGISVRTKPMRVQPS